MRYHLNSFVGLFLWARPPSWSLIFMGPDGTVDTGPLLSGPNLKGHSTFPIALSLLFHISPAFIIQTNSERIRNSARKILYFLSVGPKRVDRSK